jgi:hypothetical protein
MSLTSLFNRFIGWNDLLLVLIVWSARQLAHIYFGAHLMSASILLIAPIVLGGLYLVRHPMVMVDMLARIRNGFRRARRGLILYGGCWEEYTFTNTGLPRFSHIRMYSLGPGHGFSFRALLATYLTTDVPDIEVAFRLMSSLMGEEYNGELCVGMIFVANEGHSINTTTRFMRNMVIVSTRFTRNIETGTTRRGKYKANIDLDDIRFESLFGELDQFLLEPKTPKITLPVQQLRNRVARGGPDS